MDLVTPKPPEEIFPLEVWALILDHLRSPFDLANCNEVCKAWATHLEPDKATFLMPKVFPILYKYLEAVEYDEDDEEMDEEDDIEEIITTILKIRLVSYGWKESVDVYHQNHPLLNDIGFIERTEEKDIHDEGEPFPLLPYHFDGQLKSIEKLESFFTKHVFTFPTESNPFITRYVQYCDDADNKLQESRLKTGFKNLLEAFGSQIWTCDLHFTTASYKNMADFYKLVVSYLSLMPNLRSLQIQFSATEKLKKDSGKEELELLLQNEPLPRLEHLTKLEMANIPYPLSVGLLESNGHLQKLSLQKDDDDDDALLPDSIVNVQLPSLQQLAFPCCEMELLQLPQVRWPIKALHLTIREEESILKNIFLAVSSAFSNTLEHLVVHHWNGMENNKELRQSRLELPKLRIFELKLPFELETIDFLRGCIALEELQMEFQVPPKVKDYYDSSNSSNSSSHEDEEEVDNTVIQFKDYITSMTQSNIWRILDKLQFIKITTNGVEGKACLLRNHRTVTLYPDVTRRFTRQQFEKNSDANGSRGRIPE